MLQGEASALRDVERLLEPDDGPAVETLNGESHSRLVLLCEHAGVAVPKRLKNLGLDPRDFERHIAFDIGAEAVARIIATELRAPLVIQPYSRLVVDCNRSFEAPDCFPVSSDTIAIPGNERLSQEVRRQRYNAIHQPFHAEIDRLLDERPELERTVLVSIHSFTPRLLRDGVNRPWELGLLFNRDDRYARRLMDALHQVDSSVNAAFNQPYQAEDESDYSIPVHGERRGIEHVLIEIRNDLIVDAAGQTRWAELLAGSIARTLEEGPGYDR